MALRWLVHSACHVLGYPNEDMNHVVGCCRKASSTIINNSEISTKNHSKVETTHPSEYGFRMPLHYPRYTKEDYEKMEEWRVDMLLGEYGLSFKGTLEEKRAYAMGTFLWPDQH